MVLFAFSGWWGAWQGMGRRLYAAEPAFRETVNACDRVARDAGVAVTDRFADDGPGCDDADRAVAHRLMLVHLGVVQIALCDLWADAGVLPDAVLSVGLGEIAAAYCAGAVTRDDAVSILCAVSEAMARNPCAGQLFTVTADLATARDLCHRAPRRLDLIGTLSADRAMVYACDEDADENAAYLKAAGGVVNRESTAWAYHTMHAPRSLSALQAELAHITPRRPRIAMYSAVAGRDIAPDGAFDAVHWHWMIGHTSYFAEAAAAALSCDPGVVVNIAAAPAVTPSILATARRLGIQSRIVDSMRPSDDVTAWREARSAVAPRRAARHGNSRSADAADVGPVDAAAAPGPIAHLARLRESGPVHQVREDVWLVVAYDEVREAFSRPDVFSSRLDRLEALDFFGRDPPEHTAGRRAMAPLFRAEALAELGALAARTCDELLAARASAPELDVIGDLAAPLGERIAAHLIGLDDDELARVRHAAGFPERDGRDALAIATAALSDVRAAGSGTDLLLWLASTLNTKKVIASAVLLLLRDTALRSRVQSRPDEIAALIDETLRLHPPEMLLPRVTMCDATLGGVAIPPDSKVLLCVASANRDPAHFADADRVRLDRRVTHLSFGVGVHRCLGARLARLEAHAAMHALFEHIPGFRSVQPDCALRWIPSFNTHGLEQLLIAP